MKKHIYKITFTVIWTIFAIWFNAPKDDGREVGDFWIDNGDLMVKTGEGSFDLTFFALMMVPVVGIWLWSLFKNESDGKPVKRKSRMM
jgi:hypothetical protein